MKRKRERKREKGRRKGGGEIHDFFRFPERRNYEYSTYSPKNRYLTAINSMNHKNLCMFHRLSVTNMYLACILSQKLVRNAKCSLHDHDL